MSCPGNRMRWDLTPQDIARQADVLIEKSKKVYDAVGQIKTESASYDNVIKVSKFKGIIKWQHLLYKHDKRA